MQLVASPDIDDESQEVRLNLSIEESEMWV